MAHSDSEVVRDLRDSVSRVWETARRLGLMRLDRPLRKLLREIQPQLTFGRSTAKKRANPSRRR